MFDVPKLSCGVCSVSGTEFGAEVCGSCGASIFYDTNGVREGKFFAAIMILKLAVWLFLGLGILMSIITVVNILSGASAGQITGGIISLVGIAIFYFAIKFVRSFVAKKMIDGGAVKFRKK